MADDTLRYKRSRFATRLPRGRRYTAAHLWLADDGDGTWRVGFTKFALRMLGEPVELELEVPVGGAVELGQVVGWVEGFKAVTDLYTPLSGSFAGGNPALDEDLGLLHASPYERGWLFAVKGEPDPAAVDAEGYAGMLDATIDRMLGEAS